MWNQQGCPRHQPWLRGWTGLPGGAPAVSLPAPAQRFLSSRTLAGEGAREGPGRRGSWLALQGPHRTRPQAVGSRHALVTCPCPGMLSQTNKCSSVDEPSRVYPEGLLPEPATPAGLLFSGSFGEQDSPCVPPSLLVCRGGSPLEISGGVRILGVPGLGRPGAQRGRCVSASAPGSLQRPCVLCTYLPGCFAPLAVQLQRGASGQGL